MRLLAIDYGTKRVGLALSDETGRFAMPYQVLDQGAELVKTVARVCQTEGVATVVMGESKGYDGKDNPIMDAVRTFAQALESETGLQVVFEPEFMTSQEAKHIIGKDDLYDARAAALILKSYIDKQSHVGMA